MNGTTNSHDEKGIKRQIRVLEHIMTIDMDCNINTAYLYILNRRSIMLTRKALTRLQD